MARRVLVLNANYEPLHTTGWLRAVILVIEGTAEVIRQDEAVRVRSEKLDLAHPVVIRLQTYARFRAGRAAPTRRAILARDSHRCAYCHYPADTVDHVIPRSRPGGVSTWINLVAACRSCNTRKGNRTPDEAGMPLHTIPYEPRGAAAILLLSAPGPHRDEWLEWLVPQAG
ncbi:MAG TPA: HNH endonuclease [Microthrixaceae bacterium]|nr:HNH endonuclease [Microthrixaceae bacterium]